MTFADHQTMSLVISSVVILEAGKGGQSSEVLALEPGTEIRGQGRHGFLSLP